MRRFTLTASERLLASWVTHGAGKRSKRGSRHARAIVRCALFMDRVNRDFSRSLTRSLQCGWGDSQAVLDGCFRPCLQRRASPHSPTLPLPPGRARGCRPGWRFSLPQGEHELPVQVRCRGIFGFTRGDQGGLPCSRRRLKKNGPDIVHLGPRLNLTWTRYAEFPWALVQCAKRLLKLKVSLEVLAEQGRPKGRSEG